jgi:hypothetical protein
MRIPLRREEGGGWRRTRERPAVVVVGVAAALKAKRERRGAVQGWGARR